MDAVSYLFKFKAGINRPGYTIIKEVFIPSEKLIFNKDRGQLNVFEADEPRLDGSTKITWNKEFLEKAKTDPKLQKIIDDENKREEEAYQLYDYDRQMTNIVLPIELVDQLKTVLRMNEFKKQIDVKKYLC